MQKFNEVLFRKRLRELIDRVAQGQPGRLARLARDYHSGITNDAMARYLDGRIPGIDKAWAIAQAGGVSVDWLLGGEPPQESKYKRILVNYLRRRLKSDGYDDIGLTDDQILNNLADGLVQIESKQKRKG